MENLKRQKVNAENFKRSLIDQSKRDLSVMGSDYERGHRSGMILALELFKVWLPELLEAEKEWKEG